MQKLKSRSSTTRNNIGLVNKLRVLVEEKNTHCYLCERYLELPKDLPCNHTFCRACLQRYCLTNALEDRFPCPECHVTVKVTDPNIPIVEWVDTIPTNEETDKRLQAARQIENEKKKKFCAVCRLKWNKAIASKYCKACEEFLCDECGNQHWLLWKSKQHRVWYIEDLEAIEKDPLLRSSLDLIFNTKLVYKGLPGSIDDIDEVDFENCVITGATFLPGGELILLDKGNRKMKYFDKHHRFVASTNVQCHGVLAFSKSFIIATCHLQNKLKVFSIQDTEILNHQSIELEASCYGLCHVDDDLEYMNYVVSLSSRPVKLLFFTGTVQTSSVSIPAGRFAMQKPSYISYVRRETVFVILDDSLGCLKCVNKNGEIIWEKQVKSCKGIAVFENHILLGRSDRKTVDLVNVRGLILKSVITHVDGVSSISCLCVDQWMNSRSTTRLIVGDNTNLVRLFLLEDPQLIDDCNIPKPRKSIASVSDSISSERLEIHLKSKACTIL